LSKLYVSETTGPTAVAKDIYITPCPKKINNSSRPVLDSVEVESAEPESTISVVSENVQAAAPAAEEEEKKKESPKPTKKRKTDKTEPAVVNEEF